ncbi:phytanoyl-CoA dioxygenase family protein [Photorhabdus antumapuensis]|uniref:phytanoyl-CoA dioxygenase family protein n=1 Tax=Photorhabdus antumapuensis TaxID=2862867 RepID=UPI001CEDF5E0|nr:phytanoyl-CoA dioxygenase family protein [Photorhabdus antumapuensis]MCA6222274.1 phytanoyl-CoA dioxygenase family protein [Photorhabdus antumapuensis]
MIESNLPSYRQSDIVMDIAEQTEALGYCHVTSAIEPNIIDKLKAKIREIAKEDYYYGKKHKVMVLDPQEEIIRALCKEKIIINNIAKYLGDTFRVSMIEGACSGQEEYEEINIAEGFSSDTFLGWHRDGGILNEHFDNVLREKKLSIKCAVWLSEVKDGGGNLLLLEGSHRDFPKKNEEYKLKKITASPGDITFFDRRILHTRTPNSLSEERLVIFIEYSVKWLKRKQIMNFKVTDDEIDISLFSNEQKGWELYKQDGY